LMAEGRLPNIRALVERGRALRLETIQPTFSPVIWTSVATGKDRFHHGIHDVVQTTIAGVTVPRSMNRTAFLTKTASRFFHLLHRAGFTRVTPYRSTDVGATTVFEAASEAGLATSLVEWYVTWPARELAGVNVTDRFHLQDPTGNPIPGAVWPDTLGASLLRHVVSAEDVPLDRVLELVDTTGMTPAQTRAWARDHPRFVSEMRHNLARDLTTRNVGIDLLSRDDRWRLFGLYFRAVDVSHHLAWPLRNATGDPTVNPDLRLRTVIERYHELTDRIVGEVLAQVPDDAVIVMLSDHGFEDRYQHVRAPDGFAILAGPPIDRAESGEPKGSISVYDIAPTVAALLGLPLAEDLIGDARTDLLDPAFGGTLATRSVPTWEREGRIDGPTAADDQVVDEAELERLRAVGYIQ
ncbi:MAG: alkaline phosphatase family protein, partial [bacterium]